VLKFFGAVRTKMRVIPSITQKPATLAAVLMLWLSLFGAMITRGDDSASVKQGSSITAEPVRVATKGGLGTSKIRWRTGDGSVGQVRVSADGAPESLFAEGAEGTGSAPWIQGGGSYVFKLYGGGTDSKLLGSVTVVGVGARWGAEDADEDAFAAIWHTRARFPFLALAALLIYGCLYYCAGASKASSITAEPSESPRKFAIFRNLAIGLALFGAVDGAVFHSGLYEWILTPKSLAGTVATLTRAENHRSPSGLNEILVLGDSRMAEGFSEQLADQLGSAEGLKFISLSTPSMTTRSWFYLLREVDPSGRRYHSVVLPVDDGFDDILHAIIDHTLNITALAPVLRYQDAVEFGASYQTRTNRFRAFTACILRGSAFHEDLFDLLKHPLKRIEEIRAIERFTASLKDYSGVKSDVAGVSYDPVAKRFSFPVGLTASQRDSIERSLRIPPDAQRKDLLEYQRHWLGRILSRYDDSATRLFFLRLPRGPIVRSDRFEQAMPVGLAGLQTKARIVALDEHSFDFLEAPENFFDGFHLNARGRQKFTQHLVTELVARLPSPNGYLTTAGPAR
jgi:hypothetical protein